MESTNTLGRYQIIREIARSNDVVYEATDPVMSRRVALKELVFPPNLTGEERRARIQRFYREAKAAGTLSHPNIVTIYEVGEQNGRHFIAMEYLEGQTLRDVLKVRGAFPISEAVRITVDLCSALGYAHQRGIVHRDVKPDNIYLLPDGRVKLADFGIARITTEPGITSDGQIFGTPSYMSPEQVAGKPVDGRSDLFSLGAVLYEMLAGVKPFTGDSIVTITYNIVNRDPDMPPQAPERVTAALRRALAKDPEARFSTADEMIGALLNPAPASQPAPNATIMPSSSPIPPANRTSAMPAQSSPAPAAAPRRSGVDPWYLLLGTILLVVSVLIFWAVSTTMARLRPPSSTPPITAGSTTAAPNRPSSSTPTAPNAANPTNPNSATPGSNVPSGQAPNAGDSARDAQASLDRANQLAQQAYGTFRSDLVNAALDSYSRAISAGLGTNVARVASDSYAKLCLDAGDYYQSRGDTKTARGYWSQAVSGAPGTRGAAEADKRLEQFAGP